MKTTFRTIQNATVSVDNLDSTSREFDINADAFIQSGTVQALYNGVVTSTADGSFICGFTDNTDRSLNLNYGTTAVDYVAALEAVTAFCTAVRTSGEGKNVTIS